LRLFVRRGFTPSGLRAATVDRRAWNRRDHARIGRVCLDHWACNPPECKTCAVLGAADDVCTGSSAAMHGARCRSRSSRLLLREALLPTNKFMWKF